MKTNNVSIILYFRNQRELAEQTLTAIYENLTGPFEVCIVDDASTDGTADTLRSIIEYYSHEETYFFEHASVQGRALSIQEIIPQCSSSIIWMPAGCTTLNDEAFRIAIQQLRSSDAQFAVSGNFQWPETQEDRIDLTKGHLATTPHALPDDNQILIKLRGMDAGHWFVNPYLDGWFALEWLFRLQWHPKRNAESTVFLEVSPFTHPIDEKQTDAARKASFELGALLRRYGLVDDLTLPKMSIAPGALISAKPPGVTSDAEPSVDKQLHAKTDISRYTAAFIEYIDDEPTQQTPTAALDKNEGRVANATQPIQPSPGPDSPNPVSSPAAKTHVLKPFGKRSGSNIDAGTSEVAASLKPRLEELFAEGEFPDALKEVSVAIETNPGDVDLIRIKIAILERMRRYVEAAELKHKLKNGITEFKVRKEKVLVVDPSDDHSSRAAIIDDDQERFPSRPVVQSDTSHSVTSSEQAPAHAHRTALDTGSQAHNTSSAVSENEADSDTLTDIASVPAAQEAGELGSGEQPSDTSVGSAESEATTSPNDHVETGHSPVEQNASTSEDAAAEAISQTDAKGSQPKAFKSKPVTVTDPSETRISVIVPTTGDGKRLLESAFVALSRHCLLPDRELIVIDNASLDETYRYLNQLRKDRFMNVKVITNSENKGFAAAINQGIDVARGEYVFVMHNDVHVNSDVPGQLADLMDVFDDIDIMGPVSGVSLNPDQRMHQPETDPEALRYADYVDSFAMLIRRGAGIRFDERFETAYFEDVDVCQQVRNKGKRVAIARGIGVDHRGGATAAVLGIEPNGQQYWKNLAQFNEKWQSAPKIPYFGEEASPIFQLITISETINPYYPEKEMVQMAQRLLTSETRHEMVQTRHARSDLYALIRLMMVLDLRDVLRQLEQQLDDHDLDDQLRHELIDFYYRKHIYSRGEKYLNELPDSRKHFEFRLLQLRILMGDKKLEEAAILLNRLIEERPAHPELFKITADLHKLSGNRDEAAKFYLLAHQANPFVYSPRRDLLTR